MKKAELRKTYLAERKNLSSAERTVESRAIAARFFQKFDLTEIEFLHCFLPIEKFNEIETPIIFLKIWREFPNIENMEVGKERKAILQERFEHIQKALDRLTPKHKIIYLTYKQYESETKDGYKLPRELLKKLRTELDLTQNTVRVYKNEAFNEVETYLKIYGSK